MYRGWIIADSGDKTNLESIGIKLGSYNERTHSFDNCEVTVNVLEDMQELWGLYYWGLFPEGVEDFTGPHIPDC